MQNKTLVSLSDVCVISVAGSGPTGLLLTFHIAQRTGSNPQADWPNGKARDNLFFLLHLFILLLAFTSVRRRHCITYIFQIETEYLSRKHLGKYLIVYVAVLLDCKMWAFHIRMDFY